MLSRPPTSASLLGCPRCVLVHAPSRVHNMHARTHARTHARRARAHTHTQTLSFSHTGSRRTERRGCRCCRKSSPSAAPANLVALQSQSALLAFRTSRNTCRFSGRGLGSFSSAACFFTCVLDVKSWNALGRAQCRWCGQGNCWLGSSLKCIINTLETSIQ